MICADQLQLQRQLHLGGNVGKSRERHEKIAAVSAVSPEKQLPLPLST